MKKIIEKEFYEMSQEELMEIDGGGIWDTIADGINSFLTNRIIWTNAKNLYKISYIPITSSNTARKIEG